METRVAIPDTQCPLPTRGANSSSEAHLTPQIEKAFSIFTHLRFNNPLSDLSAAACGTCSLIRDWMGKKRDKAEPFYTSILEKSERPHTFPNVKRFHPSSGTPIIRYIRLIPGFPPRFLPRFNNPVSMGPAVLSDFLRPRMARGETDRGLSSFPAPLEFAQGERLEAYGRLKICGEEMFCLCPFCRL